MGGKGERPIAHMEGEQFLLSPVSTHTGAAVELALDRWAGRTKRET